MSLYLFDYSGSKFMHLKKVKDSLVSGSVFKFSWTSTAVIGLNAMTIHVSLQKHFLTVLKQLVSLNTCLVFL